MNNVSKYIFIFLLLLSFTCNGQQPILVDDTGEFIGFPLSYTPPIRTDNDFNKHIYRVITSEGYLIELSGHPVNWESNNNFTSPVVQGFPLTGGFIYYESQNCSGQPYFVYFEENNGSNQNSITQRGVVFCGPNTDTQKGEFPGICREFENSNSQYYYIPKNINIQAPIIIGSTISYSDTTNATCEVWNGPNPVGNQMFPIYANNPVITGVNPKSIVRPLRIEVSEPVLKSCIFTNGFECSNN